MTRLVFYLERYFEPIEADFQDRSLNLGQLVRNGKYRRMLSLIDRLPQDSRFAEAVANDEEHVAMILEAQKDQPQETRGPALSSWSTTNDQLAALVDSVNTLIAITVKANQGNPGKVKPSPRPTTKFAEIAEKQAVSRHRATVARVRKRPLPVE